MAVVVPVLVRGLVSPLQSLAALMMIITGIFDRAKHVSYFSFILIPVWTGVLILITAAVGVVVSTKTNTASVPTLVVTYRALSIFCSILCGFIALWYGSAFGEGLAIASNDHDDNAVLGIIFVLAVIAIFLLMLGTLASQERNSSYLQLVDLPMDPSPRRQTETPTMPLTHAQGSNFATCGPIQGGTQAGAATYQIMPQAVPQAGTPVILAPGYINQMGTNAAPVMLVPTQDIQQPPRTSGAGQMYFQVPADVVLPNNPQVSTPSQVPQQTTSPTVPHSFGGLQEEI